VEQVFQAISRLAENSPVLLSDAYFVIPPAVVTTGSDDDPPRAVDELASLSASAEGWEWWLSSQFGPGQFPGLTRSLVVGQDNLAGMEALYADESGFDAVVPREGRKGE
jgi:hypothetical protein